MSLYLLINITTLIDCYTEFIINMIKNNYILVIFMILWTTWYIFIDYNHVHMNYGYKINQFIHQFGAYLAFFMYIYGKSPYWGYCSFTSCTHTLCIKILKCLCKMSSPLHISTRQPAIMPWISTQNWDPLHPHLHTLSIAWSTQITY